ncbi:hypothetical protein SAMN02745163_00066 [Clostridium cavendishii DSM 21758]|uniref:Polymerase beta nucleotidyltransferase domain-containing protein n=1 Tax=Clostridium cavendishii DSM 21758 TaxID=1121302 RepID=A0A1M6AF42_9CLOT|nr:nucleotidyltransferase domain-containing protein [Clostridium cavendishii]SHI35021.1 hypothetical protein SAMN02745163_00066 [Clostridium cavendishii DSM 21758]
MNSNIIKYQNAFNSLIQALKKNQSVLAVTVFGSMITGDLWDESDIDLFVIVNQDFKGIKNIYGEEKTVEVHIKMLSKEEFLNFHESNLSGDTLHRKFFSSKLIFSKDNKITDKFNTFKYYKDVDRERWNLVYLSALMKSISECKKYMHNGKVYSIYPLVLKAIDDYSRLYLNFNGYIVNKDCISMTTNLDDSFKEIVDSIFDNSINSVDTFKRIVEYLDNYIDMNITNCSNVLINYIKNKNIYISSRELIEDSFFRDFKIDMEGLLVELSRRGLLQKKGRDYLLDDGKKLINENVYKI